MLNEPDFEKAARERWLRIRIVQEMPATAKLQTTKPSGRPAAKASNAQVAGARRERNCSVARTLDIVSDAWAFLIIREAFFGTQTFEAFRTALGIPRATLTDRLRKLTQLAIFRQVAPRSIDTSMVCFDNGTAATRSGIPKLTAKA